MRKALDIFTIFAVVLCLFMGTVNAFSGRIEWALVLLGLALINFFLFLWRKKTERDLAEYRKTRAEIDAIIARVRAGGQ